MCGASRDDVHHRCWECPHSAPARAQASPGLLRLVASMPRGDPMVTAGVYPHFADEALLPPAEGGRVVYRREGLRDIGDHVRLSGFVFPDGTCTRPILRDLARAAWAVAVVTPDGLLRQHAMGPVWAGLPQTPQAAEHCAHAAAVQLLGGASYFFQDCSAVVMASGDSTAALHPRKKYAGISRSERNCHGHGLVRGTWWTKGHERPKQVKDPFLKFLAIGNGHADALVAKGTCLVPSVQGCVDEAKLLDGASREIISVAAEALAMWPRLQGLPSRALADGRRARAARPAQVHDWAFCAGFWRCNSCLQTFGAPSLRSVCRGLPRPFRRAPGATS